MTCLVVARGDRMELDGVGADEADFVTLGRTGRSLRGLAVGGRRRCISLCRSGRSRLWFPGSDVALSTSALSLVLSSSAASPSSPSAATAGCLIAPTAGVYATNGGIPATSTITAS